MAHDFTCRLACALRLVLRHVSPLLRPRLPVPAPPCAPRQAAQVDLAEFKQRFNRPVGICIGLGCQFVLLPLAGFTSIRIFFKAGPRAVPKCCVRRVIGCHSTQQTRVKRALR